MQTIKSWEQFYADYPLTIDSSDYLKQVGHTIGGKSIEDYEFRIMVSQICSLLDLQKSDVVLDLCCGNGIITKELANVCQQVVGVDFSQPLISIAKKEHCPKNVSYYRADVLEMNEPKIASVKYTKILLFAALQHFNVEHLPSLLRKIIELSTDDRVVVLGFVPDKSKKWILHDTFLKKFRYFYRCLRGNDLMGTWWEPKLVEEVSKSLGLHCGVYPMEPETRVGRYRFHARLS